MIKTIFCRDCGGVSANPGSDQCLICGNEDSHTIEDRTGKLIGSYLVCCDIDLFLDTYNMHMIYYKHTGNEEFKANADEIMAFLGGAPVEV